MFILLFFILLTVRLIYLDFIVYCIVNFVDFVLKSSNSIIFIISMLIIILLDYLLISVNYFL